LAMTNIDGWAAVILWDGEANVGFTPIESCQPIYGNIGWLPFTPGDVVQTDTNATVIVVSLATPDGTPKFESDGNLCGSITQLLDSDHGAESLKPLLRIIQTKPRKASFQVAWPRGGVAVTTSSSPVIGPRELSRCDQGDLIFRGLPKGTPIYWTPGSDDDALAIVIDFQVESDPDPDAEPSPVSPETDGGGEGGCGWRCKG